MSEDKLLEKMSGPLMFNINEITFNFPEINFNILQLGEAALRFRLRVFLIIPNSWHFYIITRTTLSH